METTLEILTTGKVRRGGHRQWPDEVKARIVSESLGPSTTVNEVADRYGLKANHLSSWRRTMARQGKPVLPEPEDAVEFASMVVETPAVRPPIKASSRPETIVGPVTIRLEEGASAARRMMIGHGVARLRRVLPSPMRRAAGDSMPNGYCRASPAFCKLTAMPDTID